MSIADHPDNNAPRDLDHHPRFDLGCLVDDTTNPTEVTVFSNATESDLTTHWITVDINHAVPLEETL